MDTRRLNVDLPVKVHEKVKVMAAESHAGSISEVVKRALALYRIVLTHLSTDGQLVFRHKDGRDEIVHIL